MTPERPQIILTSKEDEINTNWNQYIGKLVDVIIYRKEKERIIPQFVSSKELLNSEDPELGDLVDLFLDDVKKELKEVYVLAEAGRFIIRGDNTYSSDIFTSYSMHAIYFDHFFQPLAKTVRKALANEPESNLHELIIVHTHPRAGPLSYSDITTLEVMGGAIGLRQGDQLQVMAIPIKEKGDLIFRYSLKK